MGIALGLGVVLGARAASADSLLPGLLLACALTALAMFSEPVSRRILLFGMAGCLVGLAAGHLRAPGQPANPLDLPTATITARVASDPIVSASGTQVDIAWTDHDGTSRSALAFLPVVPSVTRGDRVEIAGTVVGAAGEQIDARGVRVIEAADRLERIRWTVRRHISRTVLRHVPGSPGSLTLGLLIGDDSGLPSTDRERLRGAGLSHITAVSGWNVTLVTGAVGSIFLALGLRGWRWTFLQLAGLAAYVWIVGFEPPVIRATLMVVAALTAVRLGRPAHSVTILILTAAVMVAASPAALSSLSFQLSVLATAGLIVALRLLQPLRGWQALLWTPVVVSGAAGLATGPLLAARFGTLTLMTVPANVLAAPLVPLGTIGGVLLVVGSRFEPLAAVTGWAVWLITSLLLWIAALFAGVPFGQWQFAPASGQVMAVLYAALLSAGVLVLPEGRLILRELGRWSRREPGSAWLAGCACAAALSLATYLV